MDATTSSAWREPVTPAEPSTSATDAIVSDLYRRHVASSLRLALRYGGGDQDWAQDVVHDVFIEVQRHAQRLAQMDNAAGWIYRATTSRCLNRLKRDRFVRSPWVRWAVRVRQPQPQSLEALGVARERLGRVFEAVNRLPPKQRICFWMYHVDGKPQDEIGELLGCKKSYVSKLLARAGETVRRIEDEADHG